MSGSISAVSVSQSSTATVLNKQLTKLLERFENSRCADCSDVRPTWAVLVQPPDFAPPQSPIVGFFCCLHCSAAHGSLQNDICTVKSVKLDQWDSEEILAMQRGGNLRCNAIFEGSLYDDTIKPTPFADAHVRERFIDEKYSQLRYFVPHAYSCIGSGDEEDSLEDVHSNSVSLLSHSVSEVPRRLSSLRVPSGDEARPSLGAMHRQSSLPCMKVTVTPRSNRVSATLSMKKIASPFKAESDFWESMNASKWGNMTFEDSLHKRSTDDWMNHDRRSSWGLSEHSLPSLCSLSVSEHSGYSPQSIRGQNKERGQGHRKMPRKALSERILACSKDWVRSNPSASYGDKMRKSNPVRSLTKTKSSENVPAGKSRAEKSRKEQSSKIRNVSSKSPTKQSKPGDLSILKVLEEENMDRKASEGVDVWPERQSPEFGQRRFAHRQQHHRSELAHKPSKMQSLRDVGKTGAGSTRNIHGSHQKLAECFDNEVSAKSRSLSPQSYRRSKRGGDESVKTTNASSGRGRKFASCGNSSIVSSSSARAPKGSEPQRRRNFFRNRGQESDSSAVSGSGQSSDRSSNSESTSCHRRRNTNVEHRDHLPPPSTIDTQDKPSSPGPRNTSRQSKDTTASGQQSCNIYPMDGTYNFPRSLNTKISSYRAPTSSLSNDCTVGNPASPTKGRPRSLDSSRRNRLKLARARSQANGELSAVTEHKNVCVYQHPLFAYP